MKQDKVNVSVVPDNRRINNEERFPLKIRITHKGKRKYYGAGYDVSTDEWEALNAISAKGKLRELKNCIAIIENDAKKCCDAISPFSFKQFEKEFFNQKIQYQNIQTAFDVYIKELRENGQVGTASAYKTACNALHKFKPKLQFEDITKEFLQKFENWMLSKDYSITTVGVYLRPLRVIINLAKDNGMVKQEAYPFGKRKYVIPTGKNIKKSLSKEQVEQVFNYTAASDTNMDRAKDFWIFSYLCNGINMMDIAKLKWKNADSSTITFIREKTKRTTKGNPITITAMRNHHLNRILTKWGTENKEREDYIFGVIDKTDSCDSARKKIQQFTKVNNKWMKRIGLELGFEMKLTSYVARHSFATILVRSGAPLAFASQSLGHTNVLTTQKYFAGFDLAAQAEYTKALFNF